MLSLARLLEEVSLPETQMKINEVLSKLVQRTGKHVRRTFIRTLVLCKTQVVVSDHT